MGLVYSLFFLHLLLFFFLYWVACIKISPVFISNAYEYYSLYMHASVCSCVCCIFFTKKGKSKHKVDWEKKKKKKRETTTTTIVKPNKKWIKWTCDLELKKKGLFKILFFLWRMKICLVYSLLFPIRFFYPFFLRLSDFVSHSRIRLVWFGWSFFLLFFTMLCTFFVCFFLIYMKTVDGINVSVS